MYCDYQEHAGKWTCSLCGDVRKRLITRNCPRVPKRSAEQQQPLLTLCLACPRHTGTRCSLATGGCEESRTNLWTHWLRRGKCPEGRW